MWHNHADNKNIQLISLSKEEILTGILDSALKNRIPDQGPIFICLRNNGIKISQNWYEEHNWKESLDQAINYINSEHGNNWRKSISTIEIVLTYNYKNLRNDNLPSNSARGRKGIIFRNENHRMRFAPTEMIARNLSFRRTKEAFIDAIKDHQPSSAETYIFDSLQYLIIIKPEPLIAPIYRGDQIIGLEEVTFESVENLAGDMAEWMMNNIHEDGRLTYKYWPSLGKESDSNNMIRQFMGTVCLFRMARFYNNKSMLEAAEKNLAYNIGYFYREERDIAYIEDIDQSVKLGAAALAAIAILESTQYPLHKEKLTRFINNMWKETGEFSTFFRPEERDGQNQNFYSGETLLFWAILYKKTNDTLLLERFMKSFTYYRDFHRKNRNPAFIPWHTQAYWLIWQETRNKELHDFIFEINDWLLDFQQWEKAPCPDMRGRFYDPEKPYGPPHASATGVYIEGLIDAWNLAAAVDDKNRQKNYALALKRAIRNIWQLQFSNEIDMFYISKKDRVSGGIRTTEYDNTIRVDNVQHNMVGIMKTLDSTFWQA